MPRPSKLTPEVQSRIAQLTRAGNTVELAAAAAGISEATFYAWMERGTKQGKADAPYRDFREAVEQARAESEAILVAQIAKAASNGSWSAAAWLLERRHPDRWAKPDAKRDAPDPPRDPFAELDELSERRKQKGS